MTTPLLPADATRQELLERIGEALGELDQLPAMDDARFLETHEIFEGRSTQQGAIIAWFRANIGQDFGPGDRLRVLSVGSGSGMADVPIANGLARGGGALDYHGLDPNELECAAFEASFAASGPDGASLSVSAVTLDDYEPPHEFDVVHCIQSLYYMPDPALALRQAKALLAPGGQLVLFHAPNEQLNQLAGPFYARQYGRPTLFAEAFVEAMEDWGWDFTRERLNTRLDVTPLIRGEQPIGTALRDFIIQVDGRRLPANLKSLVADYLHHVAIELEGANYIPHPVDALVVTTPKRYKRVRHVCTVPSFR